MKRTISLSLAVFLTMGCVSNEKEFSDTVSGDSLRLKGDVASIGVKPAQVSLPYTFDKASYEVQMVTCSIKGSKGQVLIVNDGINAFTETLCKTDTAHAFYNHGFDVVGLNIPGTGTSTGAYDLGGLQSQQAVESAMETLQQQVPVVGLMGSYIGGIAAAQASKKVKDLNFLILGSAIFDLEAAYHQTSDKNLKLYVDRLAKHDEQNAVFEARSIMWDPNGIPSKVLLFHGSSDSRVSSDQAKSFRDTLATQQKMVQLKIVDNLAGPLSDVQQAALIKQFLAK